MVQFEDMRVVDLKSELKARGLPVSGLKAVLVQRLEEHDKSQGAVEGAQTASATTTTAAVAGAQVDRSSSSGGGGVGVEIKGEDVSLTGNGEVGTAAVSENAEKIPAAEVVVVVPIKEEAVLSGDDLEAVSTTTIPTTAAAATTTTSAAPEGGVEGGGGGGNGGVGGRAGSSSSSASRKSSRRVSASSATFSSSSSSASDAAAAVVYGAPTPELRSTRSKTRRASMPSAGPTAAAAAARSVDPASPLPPLKEASVVGDAGSKAGIGVGDGGFGDPERHVRLGAVVAAASVVVSAACIAAGDGLTVGNLASLHVRLLGTVFVERGLGADLGHGVGVYIERWEQEAGGRGRAWCLKKLWIGSDG